jgi:hypothetical protein
MAPLTATPPDLIAALMIQSFTPVVRLLTKYNNQLAAMQAELIGPAILSAGTKL